MAAATTVPAVITDKRTKNDIRGATLLNDGKSKVIYHSGTVITGETGQTVSLTASWILPMPIEDRVGNPKLVRRKLDAKNAISRIHTVFEAPLPRLLETEQAKLVTIQQLTESVPGT